MGNSDIREAAVRLYALLRHRKVLEFEAGEYFDSEFDSPRLTDREWEAIETLINAVLRGNSND
jgi:hypothetical protein